MGYFYLSIAEEPFYFAILVAIILGFLLLLFRKHIFSIFDPLLYYIIFTEAFCIADVLFMGYFDIIDKKYVTQYLSSEFALFAGVLLFKPRVSHLFSVRTDAQTYSLRPLFRFSLILFVGLNILVYMIRGVPLLVENRLEIYQVGGGFGLITRMFDVLLVIIFYYLLDVYRQKGWYWREWLTLFVVVAIQILSGAKSAVLTLVFIVSLHAFYSGALSQGDRRLIRLMKKMTFFAIGGFLVIAQIQISDISIGAQSLTLLDQMALRFVNNGDAFVYAYPNNLIESLDGSNPMGALFREYIAFFRLASPGELPTHIGLQLSRAFNGFDVNTQTNAKHNIFGYVNFGYFGGILYSLVVGLCIGFLRYKILNRRVTSWKFGVPYILLNLGVLTSASDWDNFSRSVLSVIFIFTPLALLFSLRRYKSPRPRAVLSIPN